jgi:hypothetical protein
MAAKPPRRMIAAINLNAGVQFQKSDPHHPAKAPTKQLRTTQTHAG